jgi:hypothetical protein
MAEAAQLATSRQLALALFEDATAEGLAVDTARNDIGFARKNILIRIVDLGVSARRLIDAAYFIVAQEERSHDLYDVELDYFKWLMRYSSRNNAHLDQVITEAQKALIQVSDAQPGGGEKDAFGSVQLIGRVSYQGGRFQFRVPSELIRVIRGPGKSHWLSLRVTSLFSLSYARVMYDHLMPYADEGVTDWFTLDELRSWQGEIGQNATVFKYFKRDWLEPAIKQVNEVSDIDVSYETRNEPGSRKIGRLRFRISTKDMAERMLQTHQEAHSIYAALKQEFGLSSAQFNQIAANRGTFNDERINQAVERTRLSLQLGNVTKSPAGFFMRALKEGWSVSDAERQMVEVQQKQALTVQRENDAKASAQRLSDLHLAAQETNARSRMLDEARLGRELYDGADQRQKGDWIRAYLSSPSGKITLRRLRIDPATINESSVLADPDLIGDFSRFVFTRMKPKVARI